MSINFFLFFTVFLTSSKHCEFIVVKALAPAGLKVNHVVRIVLVHVVAVVTEMPAFEIKSLGLEL